MSQDHVLSDKRATEASALSRSLTAIRLKLGYRSAKPFYDQYLVNRTRLDFNYSYFMKIEGAKIIPSPQIITNLCSALEEEDEKEIMLSYCETIFPDQKNLFRKSNSTRSRPVKTTPASGSGVVSGTSQTNLTPAQISVLSQSKIHYFVFLILTLGRRPIHIDELKSALPQTKSFSIETLDTLIESFLKAKLIKINQDHLSSIANDMKFPKADSAVLQKLYDQMDLWNITFHKEMKFDPAVQKMLLRRVSSRYLSVIEAHCNVLIDLIRASDELDPECNDEVLMFNVSIQRGNLPG